jgi:hypothetical protein
MSDRYASFWIQTVPLRRDGSWQGPPNTDYERQDLWPQCEFTNRSSADCLPSDLCLKQYPVSNLTHFVTMNVENSNCIKFIRNTIFKTSCDTVFSASGNFFVAKDRERMRCSSLGHVTGHRNDNGKLCRLTPAAKGFS